MRSLFSLLLLATITLSGCSTRDNMTDTGWQPSSNAPILWRATTLRQGKSDTYKTRAVVKNTANQTLRFVGIFTNDAGAEYRNQEQSGAFQVDLRPGEEVTVGNIETQGRSGMRNRKELQRSYENNYDRGYEREYNRSYDRGDRPEFYVRIANWGPAY